MGRSLVDGERSESVRRRVYLPDVDEFRSSSGPLSGGFELIQPLPLALGSPCDNTLVKHGSLVSVCVCDG